MKILNLYAGIGGNRMLWGNEHEITAVEYNEHIAKVYKEQYPNDNVIVADAHEYLLKHYAEFDFIWSSPPCPTHTPTSIKMLKYAMNMTDDGMVGQQVFAGEVTRLAYMTDEAKEGRDAFLEKRKPNFDKKWIP